MRKQKVLLNIPGDLAAEAASGLRAIGIDPKEAVFEGIRSFLAKGGGRDVTPPEGECRDE